MENLKGNQKENWELKIIINEIQNLLEVYKGRARRISELEYKCGNY